MSRKHLSPEGLRPCAAEIRGCRYGGHINDDGTFGEGTSIPDMESITNHLATSVLRDQTHGTLDLYFQAKTNLEAARRNQVVVTKAFLKDLSKSRPLGYLLGTGQDDEVVKEMIRDRVLNAEDSQDASMVKTEFQAIAQHGEFVPFQHDLARSITSKDVLIRAQECLDNDFQWSEEAKENKFNLALAFAEAPAADEETRTHLLNGRRRTLEELKVLAGKTKTGWLEVLAYFNVKEEGERAYREVFQHAEQQLATAENNSVAGWRVTEYLNARERFGSDLSFNQVLEKLHTGSGSNIYSMSTSAAARQLVKHGIDSPDLTDESKRKIIRLASNLYMDGGKRIHADDFINQVKDTWGEIDLPAPSYTATEIAEASAHYTATVERLQDGNPRADVSNYVDVMDAHRDFLKKNIIGFREEVEEARKEAAKTFASREVKTRATSLTRTFGTVSFEEQWDRLESLFAKKQ